MNNELIVAIKNQMASCLPCRIPAMKFSDLRTLLIELRVAQEEIHGPNLPN